MRTTIFYFSGTGNTWFVANELHKSLEARRADVLTYSIEDKDLKDPAKIEALIGASDHIIIGYPIYGSIAPKPMIDFIDNLPRTEKSTLISAFSTVALASGDGAIVYRSHFEKLGYVFHTGMEFKLSNNFNVPEFPDVLHVGSDEKIDARNEKAKQKIEKMAQIILSGKGKIEGDHFFGHLLGNVQRKHVDELLVGFNRKLYVEESKCVGCSKCVRICPMSNISEQESSVKFHGNCAVCMRCYHFCPTQAINVTKKSLDTSKWPRYRGATKDYQRQLIESANRNKQ